ncbi:hypothetical protein C3486_00765 [Streptomyces sp. Ru73]|nr:hypothetical protein C3486_00765 [Streptomyces sp. Ru73]
MRAFGDSSSQLSAGSGVRCRPSAYGRRQGRTRGRKGAVNGGRRGRKRRFALTVRSVPPLIQELSMADVAFVVTTLAVFALVALVAKGVAKL